MESDKSIAGSVLHRVLSSSVYSRTESQQQTATDAVLTSFRTLPEEKSDPRIDKSSIEEVFPRQETTSPTTSAVSESPIKDDLHGVTFPTWRRPFSRLSKVVPDTDLVQVTRVETYSDEESEEGTKQSIRSKENSQTIEDTDKPNWDRVTRYEKESIDAGNVSTGTFDKQLESFLDVISNPSESQLRTSYLNIEKDKAVDLVDDVPKTNNLLLNNGTKPVLESPLLTITDPVNVSSTGESPTNKTGPELIEKTSYLDLLLHSKSLRSLQDKTRSESHDFTGRKSPSSSGHPKTVLSEDKKTSSPDSLPGSVSSSQDTAKQPGTAASPTSSKSLTTSTTKEPFQLPALFSGLRVLKKGAIGEERESLSEIKQRDSDRALLSLKQHVNKGKSLQNLTGTTENKKETATKDVSDPKTQWRRLLNFDEAHKEDKETKDVGDKGSAKNVSKGDALKAFTSSKSFLKDSMDESVDIVAVKKKIQNDRDILRSIFEKNPNKSTSVEKSPVEVKVCITATVFTCN